MSLLPPLLEHQLAALTDAEFSNVAGRIFREFGEHRSGEFGLIVELLLVNILGTDEDTQRIEYGKLERILKAALGPSLYRECVASFLRRIEIGDAKRILDILGPHSRLFPNAIAARQVGVAWSLFRINNADRDKIDRADFEELLRVAYEEKETLIFRGLLRLCQDRDAKIDEKLILELSDKIVPMRDWTFLQIFKDEGILDAISITPATLDVMLASMLLACDRDLGCISLPANGNVQTKDQRPYSAVPAMLEDAGAIEEAALWSFVVDGDASHLERLFDSGGCSFSREELQAELNKLY